MLDVSSNYHNQRYFCLKIEALGICFSDISIKIQTLSEENVFENVSKNVHNSNSYSFCLRHKMTHMYVYFSTKLRFLFVSSLFRWVVSDISVVGGPYICKYRQLTWLTTVPDRSHHVSSYRIEPNGFGPWAFSLPHNWYGRQWEYDFERHFFKFPII